MRGKIGKLTAILLTAFIVLPAICIFQVSAAPIPPHRFYGSVTIAGEPAPNGTLVEAKIAGVVYANTTTVDGTYGYAPDVFDVPGDDSETPEKEGGVNGETIDFYVEGTYVKSYTFASGTYNKLDLAIGVPPEPYADFIANVTSGSEPLTVNFTDLSEYFDSITSWSWSFGNGGNSTEQNPVYTYVQNGTYTVSLTVVGVKDGETVEDTETKTDYITVLDTKPVADFTATPTSGYAPLEVNFTDASTSYDGIISWSWSFGDGGTSTEKNPTHVYETEGTYTVTLTVAEADGNTDSETKTDYITVSAVPPPSIVSFDPPYSPVSDVEGATRTFSITVDQVVNVTWLMNATQVFSEENVTTSSYTNTSAPLGVWNVSAVASNPNGTAMQTWIWNVTTVPPPPHADFTANVTSGSEPLTVAFTDLSEYFNNITSWEWDFDNDGVIDSTEQNPVYTYLWNGTYTVSLTVVGDLGTDNETKTDYITVMDTKPVADFYATPTSGVKPLEVSFHPNYTSYDGIVGVIWYFGDGTNSTEQYPVHIYTEAGTYTVTLTIWEADGDTDKETKVDYIIVEEAVPPSIIYYDPPYSPVYNVEGATRTFTIEVDQVVNVTWLVNGTLLFMDENVRGSSYTNTSAPLGTWNITAVASNPNGMAMQTWIWIVSPAPPPFLEIHTRADKYFRGDTISFYINSSKPIHIAIMIFDPTEYPAWWLDFPEYYWWPVDSYWVIPYYVLLTIPSDAPLGDWNWTALEYNATLPSPEWNVLASGTFTVESLTLEMVLERLDELNATITDIQGDIVLIETDIGTIEADIGTVKSLVEGMNATLVTIQGDVAVIKTDVATIKTKLDALNATIVDIKGDVATIETDIGTMKTGLDTINATLVEIKNGVATIGTKVGDIETDLTSINAKLVALNGTVATISSDIGSIQVSIDDINLKVVAINGTVATIETDVGTIKGTVTAIDGNIATIETDIGTLQTTVEDIKPVTGIVVPVWFAVVSSLIAAVFAIATLIWRRRT